MIINPNTIVIDIDNLKDSVNRTSAIKLSSVLITHTRTPGIKEYISFDSVPVPIIRIGNNCFCTITIG